MLIKTIIEWTYSVIAAVFLLRVWGLSVRLPTHEHYFNTLLRITDPVVGSINRLLGNPRPVSLYQQGGGVFEWISLLLAYLVIFLGKMIFLFILGAGVHALLSAVLAIFSLIYLFLNIAIWMMIISAILSWVNPMALIKFPMTMMLQPLLAPIRRWIPPIGILDLSFLVLIIVLELAQFGLLLLQNQFIYSFVFPVG